VKRILTLTALILFSAAAFAQTGAQVIGGEEAIAAYNNHGWTYVNGTWEGIPIWTSSADALGNKNTVYGVVEQEIATNSAWNYYAGGAQVDPMKTLAKVLKRSSVPTDSFTVWMRGTAGVVQPQTGDNYISGAVKVGASLALTKSGTVTWYPVEVGYQYLGKPGWLASTTLVIKSSN
jgi:hypothetical protein